MDTDKKAPKRQVCWARVTGSEWFPAVLITNPQTLALYESSKEKHSKYLVRFFGRFEFGWVTKNGHRTYGCDSKSHAFLKKVVDEYSTQKIDRSLLEQARRDVHDYLNGDFEFPEDDVWPLEKIISKRIDPHTQKKQILVKWRGWDEDHNEWIDDYSPVTITPTNPTTTSTDSPQTTTTPTDIPQTTTTTLPETIHLAITTPQTTTTLASPHTTTLPETIHQTTTPPETIPQTTTTPEAQLYHDSTSITSDSSSPPSPLQDNHSHVTNFFDFFSDSPPTTNEKDKKIKKRKIKEYGTTIIHQRTVVLGDRHTTIGVTKNSTVSILKEVALSSLCVGAIHANDYVVQTAGKRRLLEERRVEEIVPEGVLFLVKKEDI